MAKINLGQRRQRRVGKGIGGNCILLAQSRPHDFAPSLPPKIEELQESFVALFSRNIDEVSKAQMLLVRRDDYLALTQLRKRVCEVYAEVPLREEQVQQFPEHGVPQELLACAQHLAETENVCVTQVGPASRAVDVACDAYGAAKPDAEQNIDDVDWENLDTEGAHPTKPTDAEQKCQEFETNTAEDVIAVDHSNDPGLLETFAAFQTKLQSVQEAAARVIAAQQRLEAETESNAASPDNHSSVDAAGAKAAAQEQCRTLVLETKELAKKLTKPELKRMADTFAQQDQACVSTSGAPLSMMHPDTWVKCFLDFFYGDAVPNMKERGLKGTGTVHILMEELFIWLQDREELEYRLPSDSVPYKARATSRFDTPEFTAIFGCVLRHMLILRGVGVVFCRKGYEAV